MLLDDVAGSLTTIQANALSMCRSQSEGPHHVRIQGGIASGKTVVALTAAMSDVVNRARDSNVRPCVVYVRDMACVAFSRHEVHRWFNGCSEVAIRDDPSRNVTSHALTMPFVNINPNEKSNEKVEVQFLTYRMVQYLHGQWTQKFCSLSSIASALPPPCDLGMPDLDKTLLTMRYAMFLVHELKCTEDGFVEYATLVRQALVQIDPTKLVYALFVESNTKFVDCEKERCHMLNVCFWMNVVLMPRRTWTALQSTHFSFPLSMPDILSPNLLILSLHAELCAFVFDSVQSHGNDRSYRCLSKVAPASRHFTIACGADLSSNDASRSRDDKTVSLVSDPQWRKATRVRSGYDGSVGFAHMCAVALAVPRRRHSTLLLESMLSSPCIPNVYENIVMKAEAATPTLQAHMLRHAARKTSMLIAMVCATELACVDERRQRSLQHLRESVLCPLRLFLEGLCVFSNGRFEISVAEADEFLPADMKTHDAMNLMKSLLQGGAFTQSEMWLMSLARMLPVTMLAQQPEGSTNRLSDNDVCFRTLRLSLVIGINVLLSVVPCPSFRCVSPTAVIDDVKATPLPSVSLLQGSALTMSRLCAFYATMREECLGAYWSWIDATKACIDEHAIACRQTTFGRLHA